LEECFTLGDLFGEAGKKLIDFLDGGLPRPILLFCDNGDKPREFREFVPHLRVGDCVGVHDWGSEIHRADVTIFGDALKPVWWNLFEGAGSITRFLKVVGKI